MHPPPRDIELHVPAVQNVDIVAEMQAVTLLHNNVAAHVPTVQDDLQRGLHKHFHGTKTTIGALLQLGLPSPNLVGAFRDFRNAEQQPAAVQTNRERAAFVAGSQAWLDNADEQARANFAEIAQASADALEEARAFQNTVADSQMPVQIQTAECRTKQITVSPRDGKNQKSDENKCRCYIGVD